MRARFVNESLSPSEKRDEVMKILTDMDVDVPHDSYLKFMRLCKTNLSPEKIVRKLLKESVNFQKGKDPKDAMKIGVDAKVMNFLEWVRNDFQLDKSNKGEYMGYINLSDDMFSDEAMDLKKGHRLFVDDYKKYLPIMKEMGLYMFDPPWPDYEETIIYDDIVFNSDHKEYPILESVNFKKGQDPKDAMKIGYKNYSDYIQRELGEEEADRFWEIQYNLANDQKPGDIMEDYLDLLYKVPIEDQIEWAKDRLKWWKEAKEEGWV